MTNELKHHVFVRNERCKIYNNLKLQVPENAILLHVDHKDNYENRQPGDSQSAYFGYKSFSIFTAAACIRLNEKAEKININNTCYSKRRGEGCWCAFHFVKIQFMYCVLFISSTRLGFFQTKCWCSDQIFSRNIFAVLKIWIICACSTFDYSFIHTIGKYFGMVSFGNLH